MKKTLAILSAGAIAIGSLPLLNVLAANEPTPVYSVVAGDDNDTLQITIPAAGVSNDSDEVAIYVKTAAGVAVNLSTAILGGLTNSAEGGHDLANGKIVLDVVDASQDVSVTVTFDGGDLPTGNYSVSYVGTAFSAAALFYVNGANQVNVTAYVSPILTMSLVGTIVDFGELNVAGNNTATTESEITVSTNAAGGLSVLAATVGGDNASTANALGMPGSTNTIPGIGAKTAIGSLPNTEYFGASVALTPALAGQDFVANANFAGGDVNTINGTLATTTGPTKDAKLAVSYHAGIDELTEAGTYTSTITYTVTGSF